MHEMSLAENVLNLIESSALTENFKRVRRVVLDIGRLSSVEPEAMRFCFDVTMAGSIAEGAQLDIIETEGRGRCEKCACEMPVKALYDPCPQCGSYQIRLICGDAMRIQSLEVE